MQTLTSDKMKSNSILVFLLIPHTTEYIAAKKDKTTCPQTVSLNKYEEVSSRVEELRKPVTYKI